MPKKRSRSWDFRPAPILWFLLALNLTLGLLYSRITVIRKVRVEGAYDWDQSRLTDIARSLKGVPCAQINPNRVESEVLSDPDVRSATLERNLFGSAVIKLGYRNPVARLADSNDVAVTIEGIAYHSDHLDPALPTIKLPPEAEQPVLTLAGSVPLAAIARLVAQGREIANNDPVRVEVGDGREVCLNIGSGRVLLGSSDGLDSKMSLLRDQIRKEPDLLVKYKVINLTAPSAPTWKKTANEVKKQ